MFNLNQNNMQKAMKIGIYILIGAIFLLSVGLNLRSIIIQQINQYRQEGVISTLNQIVQVANKEGKVIIPTQNGNLTLIKQNEN